MRVERVLWVRRFFCCLMALVLQGCSSTDGVRQALQENPDIIFEAIEKNPERFAEAFSKASMAARKLNQVKAEREAKETMEKEFRNPKNPELKAERAFLGPSDAPITIVEYSDFQCPYCRQGYNTLKEVQKKYSQKVRIVFKHLPLPFHPHAMAAAKRFEAIALQSPALAYRFHDEVFENQSRLTSEGEKFLDASAKKIGANITRMKRDMELEVVKGRIEADMNEAKSFDMNGTPGYLINGISLRGAYPAASFDEIINRHLGTAPSDRAVTGQP